MVLGSCLLYNGQCGGDSDSDIGHCSLVYTVLHRCPLFHKVGCNGQELHMSN